MGTSSLNNVWVIKCNASLALESLSYGQILHGDRQYCYQIVNETNLETLAVLPKENLPCCILLDWELCDSYGCGSRRQIERFLFQISQAYIPVIILVEAKNEKLLTDFAQDCLVKETLTKEFLDYAVYAQIKLKHQLAAADENTHRPDSILQAIHSSLSNQFQRALHDRKQAATNLQTFLNNAPAIIYTKDLEGRYLSVNSEFEAKLKAPSTQICSKTDYDFLPSETAKALRLNDLQAILGRRVISVEETVELEDGLHTYIATKYPLLDDRGEPFALAGISIDISDRKAVENSLKVQNTILEKIAKGEPLVDILNLLVSTIESQLDRSLCSIMLCDRQGKMSFLSAPNLPKEYVRACDGVVSGEGVGSCGTAIFRKQAAIASDIATDPLWQNFKELALDCGLKACWSVPIFASNGDVLGTFGVYYQNIRVAQTHELEILTQAANIAGIALERELSAHSLQQLNYALEQKVEQRTIALKNSEARYHALMNEASDAIFLANSEGNLIECNRRAEELLGYTRDRLCELHMSQIYPLHVLEEARAHFSAVKNQRKAEILSSLVVRADGNFVPVEITGSVIEVNGDSIVQGIFRDISERKANELELKASESFLEMQSRCLGCLAIGDSLPQTLDLLLKLIDLEIDFYCHSVLGINKFDRISSISDLPNNCSLAFDGLSILEAETIFGNNSLNLIDVETNPQWQPYQELLCSLGLKTCWSIPIIGRCGRKKYGIINLFFQLPRHPTERETRIIKFIAYIASIATERNQAEVDLQESYKFTQQIADASPNILYLYDLQQRRSIYVNNGIFSILGYSAEQVYEMKANLFPTIIHEYDLTRVHAHFEQLSQTDDGKILEVEYRAVSASGEIKYLLSRNTIFSRDSDGKVQQIIGTAQDISDRKKAELESQNLRERLESVLSSSPSIIYAFEFDGNNMTTFVSKNIKSILGYSSEEFLSEPDFWNKHIYPADLPKVDAQIPNLFKLGTNTIEYRFSHQDGTYRWLQDQAKLIRDREGIPIEFVGSLTDITDRKKAELKLNDSQEKLRQSEELLRLTIENTPVGICTFDLEADFLSANQVMCEIFGYSRNEILQKNMLLLTHPDFVKLSLAGITQLIEGTEKSVQLEKQYFHKSGRIIDAISRISLVKGPEGNPLHFVASVEDVTEEKHMAIALNKGIERQEFLMYITQQIRQSLNLDRVLETAVTEVKRLLNSDRAVIFQLFEDGATKIVKEAVELDFPSILNRNWHDEHSTAESFEYYINSNIRIIPDVFQDPWASCSIDFMGEAQIKSKIVVPIILHNSSQTDKQNPQTCRWRKGNSQLWGLLIIHSCKEIRQWQPEEAELLKQVSNQLAIAIQQASLFEQVQIELTENKRLNLLLNSELDQKKILLKEIHHRVKNNLQIMSSILYLQFRNTPPEIKLISEEYQSRIHAMALIHDQLHHGDDLSHIDFHNYIADLTTNLFECYGIKSELIQLEIEVKDISLTLERSIPLGLILSELISNALKYAFPKFYGKITIQLIRSDQNLVLTVSDNGIGIPEDLDLINTETTGMQLVQSLTEQLEGEFDYNCQDGSSFQITFPLI
jgi:PAS domain S-box-containing protein